MPKLLLRIVALLTVVPGLPTQAETLTFAAISDSAYVKVSTQVLHEAYAQLGFDIRVAPYPSQRSLLVANSGEIDGELHRIANIEEEYSNLVRVPTPVNILEGVYLSKDPILYVADWQGLAPYIVGRQRGIKFIDRGLEQVGNLRLLTVNSSQELRQALEQDRIQIAIMARLTAVTMLANSAHDDIVMGKNTLASHPLYHYIHESRRDLLAPLDAILQKMSKEGRIAAIREKYQYSPD